MNLEAALDALRIHCQAEFEPLLTEPELAFLAASIKAVDSEGRAPTEAGYVPTYSLNALPIAVARGWELKAAKVVADVTFSADGSGFSNSHKHDHCLAQAAIWRKQVVASVPISRPVVPSWP